jgi:hypothetical protein
LKPVAWSKLIHGNGYALDTPRHLEALLDGDLASTEAAFAHVWSVLSSGGRLFTATPPTIQFLIEHLTDPRIRDIREAVLAVIVDVVGTLVSANRAQLQRAANYSFEEIAATLGVEAAFEDSDAVVGMDARAKLELFNMIDLLVVPILACFASEAPRERSRASQLASYLVRLHVERWEELVDGVKALVSRAEVDERSAHVVAFGFMRESVEEYLDDPAPQVRTCAALSESCASSNRANGELISALEVEDTERWFKDQPPQFSMPVRFAIITVLLKRVADFGKLTRAAIRIATTSTWDCVDHEWGPLLARAFEASPGKITTRGQRQLLKALVDNKDLWRPHYGNPKRWFVGAGLQYDRHFCIALLETFS